MDTVTIDKAGRVVIPKSLRDRLRLAPGDALALQADGEQVTLRPVRGNSALRKVRGIWVFHGGGKLSAADTERALHEVRGVRHRDLRGA